MANALVAFMLQKLDKVYLDYIHQEVITLVVGVQEDVKKLTTTFKVIQAVLNDAEQRQIKDKAVKLWLEEFKDIAYDMDDVLDEWSYVMQNDTREGNNKKKVTSSYLCSLCSCFSKVALRHNIGTKIKDIKERLDLAESEKHKYRFVEMKSDEMPTMRLKSSSLIDVSEIVGRVTETETIMNKLLFLGESSTSTTLPKRSITQALYAPNIISIVGMGGLGKTTLAQLVFNDDQVKTHFEKTMWVCVSDPFDLVTVTKAIIKEANCEVPDSSEWNELQRSLIDSLKEKRFLLVLDDVWTEDRTIWEKLELSFKYGAKGSQILVTTRKEGVALMMKAYIHPLKELSDNDCSLLLNHIALDGRNEENHDELKKIGEEISKKCKGLPLAAKTLGGLLLYKKSKKEWLHLLKSDLWNYEEVENDFLKPALLLSYYDLPLHLKGCFVYCSIFPKDHEIEKDVLVKLWMAQGFLNPRSTNEELEMMGEDYFNNLVMRSFFQDFTKDDNGDIISCKMHDLVHDLAQYLTKNECSVKHNNDTQFLDSSSRVRHLTIIRENSTDSYDGFKEAKKLRTLQFLNGYRLKIEALVDKFQFLNVGRLRIKESPVDIFHRFRCLRVLCLNCIGLENLSGEIENLIHLRYLDLSDNTNLKILPETISNLSNLQTLKLNGCISLCELPREMRRMTNLRHLDIIGSNQLSHIPQGIGGLTCLRTLSDFIVGGAIGGCKTSELGNLNLLQGGLSIRGLGRVETVNEALEIVLKQRNLHSVGLGFEHNEETENELLSKRMEGVLEVLEPHPDVVELEVSHYLGLKLSSWIESTSILSHVKTLKLCNCINLTKFPAFGQLPSLEVLEIRRAIKVKHIGFEFYSSNSSTLAHVNCRVPFPKLKKLHMEEMNNLEVWELQHGVVMPCLRLIKVNGCPKLKALPALGKLPSLEEFFIEGAFPKLTHIGCEFLYEVDEEEAAGGEVLRFNNNTAAFPKLKSLIVLVMGSKEMEWEFEGVIAFPILPCLRSLLIGGFRNSKPFVEILSKISSLEFLKINGEATEFIKYIRHDDIDDDLLHTARETILLFPKLKELELRNMEDMEELKIGFQVMPLLKRLSVVRCNKLKAIQVGSLESLELRGSASLCELRIPNLKRLHIMQGPIHPSLPEAFATTLQALEVLIIYCQNNTLTCMPEQVQQLTGLKSLELSFCSDELVERCRKDEGEDWRIISHIPNIVINGRRITGCN